MKSIATSAAWVLMSIVLAGCSSSAGGERGAGATTTTTTTTTTVASTSEGCGDKPAGLRCYAEMSYPNPVCVDGQWTCTSAQACDQPTDLPCPDGTLCFDESWSCGAEPHGRCLAAYTEAECSNLKTHEVCGCDGKTYPDICAAHAAGVNVTTGDLCAVPSGMFKCGYTACTRQTEYCDHFGGDQDYIGRYECRAIPAGTCAGATLSCSCFSPGEQCSDDGNGGITAASYN